VSLVPSKAYTVESRPVPTADGIPREPVPIGIVQYTGGSDEGRLEREKKEMAVDLLMYHSPLVNNPAWGHSTWHAELSNIDADSLGPPFFEKAADGYRIWLLSV
jgi:hypothetical protein